MHYYGDWANGWIIGVHVNRWVGGYWVDGWVDVWVGGWMLGGWGILGDGGWILELAPAMLKSRVGSEEARPFSPICLVLLLD